MTMRIVVELDIASSAEITEDELCEALVSGIYEEAALTKDHVKVLPWDEEDEKSQLMGAYSMLHGLSQNVRFNKPGHAEIERQAEILMPRLRELGFTFENRGPSRGELKRAHLLRTVGSFGPASASLLTDRYNAECEHDLFDDLPDQAPQGMSSRLRSLVREGLVEEHEDSSPVHWSLTDKGREEIAEWLSAHPQEVSS